MIEDFNLDVLHIETDTPTKARRPMQVLDRLRRRRGLPQALRTDNGPGLCGEAIAARAKSQGMTIPQIPPGEPIQSACIERFSLTLGDAGPATVRLRGRRSPGGLVVDARLPRRATP